MAIKRIKWKKTEVSFSSFSNFPENVVCLNLFHLRTKQFSTHKKISKGVPTGPQIINEKA